MGLFKKEVKFISATCPVCKGNLQLDANLETAFCQYCGAQCIIENAPKKEKKQSELEIVLDFYERQQFIRRQEKQEKQRKIEVEEKEQKEHLKKYGWIYILAAVGLFVLIFIMAILENQGIV